MSALLENSVYCFKAKIDKGTCSFFKFEAPFHDMDHTHIARCRMRCWNEVINCVRYQCTIDWYFNRYIIDDDEEHDEKTGAGALKYDECLILKILCRTAPSVKTFNKESFLEEINTQYQNSEMITYVKDKFK